MAPAMTTVGQNSAGMWYLLPKLMSHGGKSRVEPSRKPMYQSGWEADDTCAGLYGPHSQIGLICTRPPRAAHTPKTMKNRPPDLAANTGKNRLPTTLCSVRPGPG